LLHVRIPGAESEMSVFSNNDAPNANTKLPNIIPNLNQILFNGVRIFEFKSPKIKKIIAIIKDQILIFPSLNNGNIETAKNNRKKTIPKLLFVPILILLFFKLY